MAYFLPPQVDFFPHPYSADEDGLLAVGSRLDVSTMLLAYQFGIFPWTSQDEPLLWWYLHPRCVLFPDKLKVSKSMRPYLNGQKFSWSMDTAFKEVMSNCKKQSRKGQEGTWIFEELQDVFFELHELGHAHSVEVWSGDELVGGLYGMALGKIFFGESMFAKESNASKFGFIKLVQHLKENGYHMIDCQQETGHLVSLGAEMITSELFMSKLKSNILVESQPSKWHTEKQT